MWRATKIGKLTSGPGGNLGNPGNAANADRQIIRKFEPVLPQFVASKGEKRDASTGGKALKVL